MLAVFFADFCVFDKGGRGSVGYATLNERGTGPGRVVTWVSRFP